MIFSIDIFSAYRGIICVEASKYVLETNANTLLT